MYVKQVTIIMVIRLDAHILYRYTSIHPYILLSIILLYPARTRRL